MKRASYREAVRWIALNDSPGDDGGLDPKIASELVTSVLIADLFDVSVERIGSDIVRERERHFVFNTHDKAISKKDHVQ
jgi:hypothetical protein